MATTLFVLLDACRWDYLRKDAMPWLSSFAAESIYAKQLVPGAGFCERSEIATGASSATTGNFSAIGFDPEGSPYRPYRHVFSQLRHVERIFGSKIARKAGRFLQRKLGIQMTPYRIPFDQLPYFRLTEDLVDHLEPGAFAVESIYDVMREKELSCGWHFTALGVPNGDDGDRMDSLERGLREGKDALHLLYLEHPDRDGHHLGPDSEEMRQSLLELDQELEKRVTRWREIDPELAIVMIGDHGMTQVRERVDLMADVERARKKVGLRWKRDLVAFFDSTIIRLWFNRHWAAEPMIEELSKGRMAEYGEFISPSRARDLGIPFPSALYGDLLWWARPGVMVEPDCFHSAAEGVAGMHGYDPAHRDSRGFALLSQPGRPASRIEEAHLFDICPTLADLLEIRRPSGNEGKSLLDRIASPKTSRPLAGSST